MSERDMRFDTEVSHLPPSPEKATLMDDFMDIFYAPSKVFARRANKSFWIPLLIVAALFGGVFIANRDLMEPIMEAEMTRAMEQNPGGQQLTEQQMEASRRIVGTFAVVGAFVFTPITLIALGIVVWLVGKFFDTVQTLNAAITVAVFSYVPRVVEGILSRVQGLFVDTSQLTSRYSLSIGPGRFLDADTTSPILLAIVGRLDLFTLWVTVLIAIGLMVTGKISGTKAAIAAAVVWIVGALPTLAGALRAG